MAALNGHRNPCSDGGSTLRPEATLSATVAAHRVSRDVGSHLLFGCWLNISGQLTIGLYGYLEHGRDHLCGH